MVREMEFVDIILIVLYLAFAAAIIAVVWSKMRTLLKTAIVSAVIAIGAALIIWFLPNIIESENNDALWNGVADVFLVLITISLLASCGTIIWSMLRRR